MRLSKSYGSVVVTAAAAGTLFVDGVEVGPLSAGSEARLDRVESGQRVLELRHDRGSAEKTTVLVSAGATAKAAFAFVARPLRSDAFVLVEGGEFTMGDATGKSGDKDDKPAHKVRVDGFLMAKYEITQGEYAQVMGDDGHLRQFGKKPSFIEYTIGWSDAVEFCNRISREEGLTPCYSIPGSGTDPALWPAGWKETRHDQITCNWDADGYRLPTEAEWEYAARGGKLSKGYAFAGANDVKLVSIVMTSISDYTPGKKPPNELGLYDMSNMGWEWCWDRYDAAYYASSPSENPLGPEAYMAKAVAVAVEDSGEEGKARGGQKTSGQKNLSGPLRVTRGGLYGGYGRGKEVWFRYAVGPVFSMWNGVLTSLRLVRSLPR
jgi:formylglycine-generating enzyme required for sulfatase activity